MCTSPLFNAAIGRLLRGHSADDQARLLRITGLDSPDHDLLRRVIESGKRYYASADYREAQSRVVGEFAEADCGPWGGWTSDFRCWKPCCF